MVHKSKLRTTQAGFDLDKEFLGRPYLKHLNVPRTSEMYEAIVDPPDETDDKSGPRANCQKTENIPVSGQTVIAVLRYYSLHRV
jgi:hypothetical protein